MYIADLTYVAPLEQIDAHMKEHMQFLNKYYKADKFLASGRKVPRTGGIILMAAQSKEEAESIMSEDPFCKHKLAEFTVTEFRTSQVHPEVKKTGLFT